MNCQYVTCIWHQVRRWTALSLIFVLGACSAANPVEHVVETMPPTGVEAEKSPGVTSTQGPGQQVPTTDLGVPHEKHDELIVIGPNIPSGLDPVHELTSVYLRAIGAGECLLKITADGSIVPELAESYTAVDPITWKITLRPFTFFWSGAQVNAKAVKASLERSRKLEAQAALLLTDTTITVVDDLTLNFVTKTPNFNLPLNLAYYQLLIHNAESYGDQPNPFDLKVMDLTGMFQVTSFTPNQVMTLEMNLDYWRALPRIQRVRFEEVKDPQARLSALQNDKTHIVLDVPLESAATLKDNSKVQLISAPAANTTTIYLNLKSPIVSNLKVRQALGWGSDRQELVELSREGYSQPMSSWLASNPAFSEATEHGFTAFDVKRAATLLDEAGWKRDGDSIRVKEGNPLALRLLTFDAEKAVGEVLQKQWRRLGVQLDAQHADDYGLIQAKRDAGDWDALIEVWDTFGNPQALLADQFKPNGKVNYGGYDDPETNQLFEQLAQAEDDTQRHKFIVAINKRVSEQAPVIALHSRPQIIAISAELQAFEPHFRQFEHIVLPAMHFSH